MKVYLDAFLEYDKRKFEGFDARCEQEIEKFRANQDKS